MFVLLDGKEEKTMGERWQRGMQGDFHFLGNERKRDA
jgi:hypothetical protein